ETECLARARACGAADVVPLHRPELRLLYQADAVDAERDGLHRIRRRMAVAGLVERFEAAPDLGGRRAAIERPLERVLLAQIPQFDRSLEAQRRVVDPLAPKRIGRPLLELDRVAIELRQVRFLEQRHLRS